MTMTAGVTDGAITVACWRQSLSGRLIRNTAAGSLPETVAIAMTWSARKKRCAESCRATRFRRMFHSTPLLPMPWAAEKDPMIVEIMTVVGMAIIVALA